MTNVINIEQLTTLLNEKTDHNWIQQYDAVICVDSDDEDMIHAKAWIVDGGVMARISEADDFYPASSIVDHI